MATVNQAALLVYKKQSSLRAPRLCGSPQRKGIIIRLRICTPRKPNSARRPITRTKLSTHGFVLSHIPGVGHNLRRHSRVLVCGVGPRDLPMVNYTCIRGVYDFEGLLLKQRRRSIYGAPMNPDKKTHIRRCFREFVDE